MRMKGALIILRLITLSMVHAQTPTAGLRDQISQLLSVMGAIPTPPAALAAAAASVRPLVYPGCSDIDSLGSPILLVHQVHQMINDYMRLDNKETFVQFIYSNKEEIPAKFSTIHTLMFKLSDASKSWYVGMKFDNHVSGLGSVKFLKTIVNNNPLIVYRVLGISPPPTETVFSCGDFKMIFSSFGNDGGMPGNFAGANRNRAPPALVNEIRKLKPNYELRVTRFCDRFRMINSREFYFVPNPSSEPKPSFPVAIPPAQAFETFRCSPESEKIIDAIELDCQSPSASSFAARLVSIRIRYKVPFEPRFETTPIFGKQTGASPGNYSFKQTINFVNVSTIDVYYLSDGSIAMRFFDNDLRSNLVNTFNCGNTLGWANNGANDSVKAVDLLGFWGGVDTTANGAIKYLGLIKFSAIG